MKLYKFRPLLTCCNYDRVISIIRDGFYCCDFLNFNDVYEGVFPVTAQTKKITLSGKLKYRICSFSEEGALSSQLMWGHYAEAGMGVAIEIEPDPDTHFEKVHYDKPDRHNGLVEILTNKSAQWSHEEEWRYISKSRDDYLKEKITKIYFGTPYRDLINYQEIKTKHHKLQEYLQRAETLREECSVRRILCKDYKLT